MDDTDLLNRFTFHQATETTGPKFDHIRAVCLDLAQRINIATPDSREKSLAITHLEEVMYWANASVARN